MDLSVQTLESRVSGYDSSNLIRMCCVRPAGDLGNGVNNACYAVNGVTYSGEDCSLVCALEATSSSLISLVDSSYHDGYLSDFETSIQQEYASCHQQSGLRLGNLHLLFIDSIYYFTTEELRRWGEATVHAVWWNLPKTPGLWPLPGNSGTVRVYPERTSRPTYLDRFLGRMPALQPLTAVFSTANNDNCYCHPVIHISESIKTVDVGPFSICHAITNASKIEILQVLGSPFVLKREGCCMHYWIA